MSVKPVRSRFAQNSGERIGSRGALKRRLSADYLVEDDAETEDVAPVIDSLSPGLLGRHVSDRPHDFSGIRFSTRERLDVAVLAGEGLHELGKTEVDDLGMAGFGHHDVGGLYIAVDDGFLMRFGESLRDIRGDFESTAEWQRAFGKNISELLAADELHDDEGRAFDFIDLVNDADMGMLEFGRL
jgi:hypothetical protein